MKALVYTGPEQLEFQDFADPTPADVEVIVNVACDPKLSVPVYSKPLITNVVRGFFLSDI